MSTQYEYHQLAIGPMQNYTYFIGPSQGSEILVVDPGWEADLIIKKSNELGKKIVGILCSHSHKDHVEAIPTLLKTHDVPVYMSKDEIDFFNYKVKNLRALQDGEKVPVGDLEVIALLTPGHTVGSMSFLFGPYLLTGDTLFIDGCGRCDLQSSNAEQLYMSFKKIIDELPENTIILPGHNYGPIPIDSLKGQLATNTYLKHNSLSSFLTHRMTPRI